MTTQKQDCTEYQTIDDEPDDLLAMYIREQMVAEERWGLTELGRERLREARAEDEGILQRLQDRDERRFSNIMANR